MMCDDCIYSKDDVCINENTMFSYDGDCLSKIDKESYSKIYNKAIDDYMNKLCNHCMQQTNECYKLECPFCTDGCDIVNIAEQLKEGGAE